jgi:hypothetical protein
MKRIKKNNNAFIIITLLTMVFTLTIGYAKIGNTETYGMPINSNFKLDFANATLVNSQGINNENTTCTISNSSQDLIVNVSDLAYPGAGAEFSVDIINTGNIKTKINSIEISKNESPDLKITILNEDKLENLVLQPCQSTNMHFTVVWDYNSTTPFLKTNFELHVNYSQTI